MIAAATSSLVVCAIAAVIICLCIKKNTRASRQTHGRVDMNPVYGECEAYYEGREKMQVEDSNTFYGAGEEGWEDSATDRNSHYQ